MRLQVLPAAGATWRHPRRHYTFTSRENSFKAERSLEMIEFSLPILPVQTVPILLDDL